MLVLLALLLIAILTILLVPIRYSVTLNGRQPYEFDVKIKWLYRLFSLHFAYHEDKPFFKEIYFLGKMRVGPVRDYEEWLEAKIQQEVESSESEDDIGLENEISYSETQDRSQQAESIPEIKPYKATFDSDGKVLSIENTDGSVSHETKTQLKEVSCEKENISQKEGNDFEEKLSKFWWKPYVFRQTLWEKFLLAGKRTYYHSKPREIFIEGVFGLKDPFSIGILASIIYSIWPQVAERVQFDYISMHCHGSAYVKGRILPVYMAWVGTCLMLSKPMRDLLIASFKWWRMKDKH